MIARALSLSRSFFYHHSPTSALTRRLRPRAAILVYHRVAAVELDPDGQAVSPPAFERQLRLLRRYYHVTSLESLLERLPSRAYPDRTVAVTFDDGYQDNLLSAYPIAASLGIPLTVFVTTQPVLEGGLFWWDRLAAALRGPSTPSEPLELGSGRILAARSQMRPAYRRAHEWLRAMPGAARELALNRIEEWATPSRSPIDLGKPMTPAELRELARLPFVAIGAHTTTHPALGHLGIEEQRREIAESRRVLEDTIDQEVRLLAYPFGKASDISPTTCELAAQAGYRAAFTSEAVVITSASRPYRVPRMIVHGWPDEFFLIRLQRLFGQPRGSGEHVHTPHVATSTQPSR